MGEKGSNNARFKTRNLLGVVPFLWRYPRAVIVTITLLLVIIGIELTLPQIIGQAVSGLESHLKGESVFEPGLYVQIFLALALVRAGLGFVLGPIRNRLVQRSLADIRAAIYDSLQRLAFSYHDKSNSGELISRSTTDVFRLQDFFFGCLVLSFDIAISLVAVFWLIWLVSPMLALIAMGTAIPTIGLIAFYATKLQPQWRLVHDQHGEMTTVIQENIAGVRVVKAFAKEAAEVEKFRRKKEAFLQTVLKTVNYWAARVPFAQFIFGLSMPLVLWVGGRQVIQGQLAIGDLTKIVFYIMTIGHRMGMVGQFTNIIQNASASAERILEIIHEPQTIRSGHKPLPKGRGAVEFENVSFNYAPSGRASITDVSFRAEPGQTVAIVGPTGSGKTTLVNLIPRFYDAASGRVLIDGMDVRDLELKELRHAVSVIFQETFLFSASVAENIAYGKPGATREQVEQCARAAQAHEFICELEEGYDTVIGERGISLSGGQRQRIAIARAFLMNPRILILDDATASVDPTTEHLIQTAMRRLCEGRTTFVIAQRFSTVHHADQILVLKDGRIVERGTHKELIRQSGFYGEIFEQQIHK
ncbi:MAG: ABC transporter ATP-binding protein/permease [Verrucomicrobia subdivision 3 bacterium]|nr:ABC transporter ATP-binding protein/permease [Limisphaerales bacterium]